MNRYWTIPIFSSILILGSLGFSQDVFAPANQTPEKITGAQPQWDEASQAIPEWVKTQFAWYLSGDIDEGTLLTSMNWMFDNNIMHLSEKAAEEVKQLRDENARYKELLGHELSHTIQQDTSGSNSDQTNPGERVMQPEFDSSQSKVVVRGWDPEKKEEIVDSNKAVAKFVVELYAESLSLSDVLWLPMTEGEVLAGYEGGDPERPIIIGRIYNESSQIDSSRGTMSDLVIVKSSSVEKIKTVNEMVDNILRMGGTASTWEENISGYQTDSSQKDSYTSLNEMVFLYSNAIDRKTIQIDSELKLIEQWIKIIEENRETSSYDAAGRLTSNTDTTQYNQSELDFIGNKLSSIDQRIKALSNGVAVLDRKVQSMDESNSTTQTSADMILKGKKILQNLLEEQQKKLDGLSEKSEQDHEKWTIIVVTDHGQ